MASVFKRQGKGNYVVQYYDHKGVRKEKSSRTTDKRAAEQLASKLEADAMLRRERIIDPAAEQTAKQRDLPLSQHLEAYLVELGHKRLNPRHVQTVKTQLRRLINDLDAHRLVDLDADRVKRHLHSLAKLPVKQLRGTDKPTKLMGPRTINGVRTAVIAFLNWAVQTQRLPFNPCSHIPKVDETQDKRVRRRALTGEELARLVQSSGPRGSFYLVATLTGLRMKEMSLLTWGQIDFGNSSLFVPASIGKAKRDDWIALHPEVVETLRRLKSPNAASTDRVFPTQPTTRTFVADLEHAGIPEFDPEGRRVDRHALRTTTGTLLARAGVSPQEARLQMRHANIETTLNHYTDLRLSDQRRAVSKLPAILGPAKTPTTQLPKTMASEDSTMGFNRSTGATATPLTPQHWPQQSQHLLQPILTTSYYPVPNWPSEGASSDSSNSARNDEHLRVVATQNIKAGDEDRTRDIQLGNARAPDRNPRESGHFRRAARPLAHALAHGPRPDGNSGPAPVPPRSPTSRPARRWPRSPDVANRRAVGPTWRDVGVYASTHTESATMPPWAGIL